MSHVRIRGSRPETRHLHAPDRHMVGGGDVEESDIPYRKADNAGSQQLERLRHRLERQHPARCLDQFREASRIVADIRAHVQDPVTGPHPLMQTVELAFVLDRLLKHALLDQPGEIQTFQFLLPTNWEPCRQCLEKWHRVYHPSDAAW